MLFRGTCPYPKEDDDDDDEEEDEDKEDEKDEEVEDEEEEEEEDHPQIWVLGLPWVFRLFQPCHDAVAPFHASD